MGYSANDIETLDFREAIRKRIEMYMGSADNQGVIQCIREIASNCIDESIMGYGNKITIELSENNKVKISDEGRGCPFGKREDGTEALEAIFMTAHSGGKFSDKTYQSVIGMNGIGGKGVALSSSYFKVESSRDGKTATLILKDGLKEDFFIKTCDKNKHGTVVEFIPSAEVYRLEEIHIDFKEIEDMCKNWSYLNKGISLIAIDNITNKKITFCAKNGLLDLIKDKVSHPVHQTPIYIEQQDGELQIEIAAQWTKDKEHSYIFTNGLFNSEGGTSLTGIKTSITRTINKTFNASFSGEMARSGLIYAVSCKIPNPSFANQTKTKINNPELRGLADKGFAEAFNNFNITNATEVKQIGDFLKKEQKAEAAAERARTAALENQKMVSEGVKKKSVLAGKLVDCERHDETSQLLIVEGKSALGAIVKSRDSLHTAAYPLRGKIINCLKNPMEEVFENEEIKEIQIALGCGIGDRYNSKKLRYGRVGIMADADMDGYSIMCLVLTFFYRYLPEMIREGRVCWALTPLFKVSSKGKKYYAYNEEELKALPKGEITRLKGLGESDPQDFRDTVFSNNGKFVTFSMEDAIAADYYMNLLMGTKIEDRREYIFKNVDFSTIEE